MSVGVVRRRQSSFLHAKHHLFRSSGLSRGAPRLQHRVVAGLVSHHPVGGHLGEERSLTTLGIARVGYGGEQRGVGATARAVTMRAKRLDQSLRFKHVPLFLSEPHLLRVSDHSPACFLALVADRAPERRRGKRRLRGGRGITGALGPTPLLVRGGGTGARRRPLQQGRVYGFGSHRVPYAHL